jgi:hypothetical protein
MSEFVEFPKMGRLTRECVITEKIDGTNAQILIVKPEMPEDIYNLAPHAVAASRELGMVIYAGSRTRYITPDADNFGFAAWVKANADALFALGEGRHYGEWWGSGIQRGYGLTKGEKRFSLFNVARWHAVGAEPYVMQGEDPRVPPKVSTEAPACCSVVPVLFRGLFGPAAADNMLAKLRAEGSAAAPGFMNPEGIVIFHTAAGTMFKKTLEKDEQPKSRAREMQAVG